MKCKNTALDGTDKRTSTLRVTQKRESCPVYGLSDFNWPREIDRMHSCGDPILIFHEGVSENGRPRDMKAYWRKTTYDDVLEVPHWKVILTFNDDGRGPRCQSFKRALLAYWLI